MFATAVGHARQPMLDLIHITTVPYTLGFLYGQMRWMRDAGFKVGVVASPPEDEEIGKELKAEFPARLVPMRRAISPLHDVIALTRLLRLLRRERPLIVHAHTPKAGLLSMLAARLAGVPIRVYHLHGLRFETARGWRRWLLTKAESLACRFATQTLCVSDSVRNALLREHVVPANQVKFLGNGSIDGVDATERFNPGGGASLSRDAVRRRLGIPDGAMILGFVGRLTIDKGVVELAEAWRLLRERHDNLHLLVLGGCEQREPPPAGVWQTLKQDRRVCLTGQVADPQNYYALMDVLCLPTYREGLPYALLEASAMQTPIVATEVSGCVDAVVDGVTGLLVPPKDPAALATAISRYLSDDSLRREHGRAGRRRVLAEFPPELLRRETLREYRRLAAEEGVLHRFPAERARRLAAA